MRLAPVLWTMLSLALPTAAAAATSDTYSSTALTARLITAEDGVAPEAGTLSAGLVLEMADGWKTYWRNPGAAGEIRTQAIIFAALAEGIVFIALFLA